MPRDNHPRARQARQLARKQGTKPPYERVLIVTEGTKTEPNYFEEIRRQNAVPSAHVRVMPSEKGTEPLQVVEFAKETFSETRSYDRVYVVFDRDDHKTYNDALTKSVALDKKLKNIGGSPVRFIAIPSVPCFELWLLLHYEDVQAFWHRSDVIDKLTKYIPRYEKGATGIYKITEQHLEISSQRAALLRARFVAETGKDPFTKVDELVALLRSIRLQS